ncbi:MAG TPA: peptide chain release factor N(5)-glutamine methyltransferase [Microbacteriaceae bacterium]|jgi:release factor glutamine methyltransferase|nr:peptide chain release factor N(5)-glutamine methyltransferase [Microbacteriaceae bacterium]HQL55960.1 peptide chain release factor N(5)-glutamine methyltransferase [Phycisphaerae bacterium]HQX35363.1 peptide chain release factor N(5)-glutamine methyltransferase [Microbacteriaceae bacterium]HQZ48495.1 peptide chain release factor N(5)-glutamine methyltransferase [Microbacteriaceae bacterium]HRA09811.1 peptide chain release factor N(5)-glutamine methyltransferase [Microbacteriaceae bacterium]
MSDFTVFPPAPAPVSDVLAHVTHRLAQTGILDADVDAEWLVGHVLELGRGAVQAAAIVGTALTDAQLAALASLVARRAAREPLQHITGLAAFRRLSLNVGPGVFVPRPETEGVAQFAIDALRAEASPAPIGIDLGTGSGAIALAMATEVPNARIFAAENSPEAFPWTRRNFDEVGAPNATLVFADLAVAFSELDGTVDVLISNPPYVPDDAIPRDPEVRNYDPAVALYGGPDGLDVVRVLSVTAQRLLRPGGVLIIEHGELQGRAIRELLTADGWRATATHPDLTMRDRATTALRP